MRTSNDDWDLATNMKGLQKSRDGHVRDGEWPEATTPAATAAETVAAAVLAGA